MKVYRRKYKDPQGRERTGKTWWALYYVGGRRFHESLGTRDKRAADLIAGDRLRREELKRAGIKDPYGESQAAPIEEHVADFERTLRAKDVVQKYVADRMGCLRSYVTQARIRKIKDLDLPGASAFLTSVKDTGVSARSVNRYFAAIKQFGRWLVATRRVQYYPFEGMKPLNEAADRRHVRRALTPEEAGRLLEAARTRPLRQAEAARIHAGVTPAERLRLLRQGEVRALIYEIALGTGLRRGEILRLRWCDVDLDRAQVRVPAASAKSRKDQSVPLNDRLAASLRAARPKDAGPLASVIPAGAFPNTTTFHRDLADAGVERTDAEGRCIDFHALRTTFVSWLAMSGAHPKVAQALARHASIETTMERYTDLSLIDVRGTVERMPGPVATAAQARRRAK